MISVFLLFSHQRLICAACETGMSCEIQQVFAKQGYDNKKSDVILPKQGSSLSKYANI